MNPKFREVTTFFNSHLEKILRELKEEGISISLETISEVIGTTSFKKRKEDYPNDCPCYTAGEHCYDRNGKVENPNCFLCGCPEFKIDLDSEPTTSCKLEKTYQPGTIGKGGYYLPFPNSPDEKIWACERCPHPYNPTIVENYLRNNMEMLKKLSNKL